MYKRLHIIIIVNRRILSLTSLNIFRKPCPYTFGPLEKLPCLTPLGEVSVGCYFINEIIQWLFKTE